MKILPSHIKTELNGIDRLIVPRYFAMQISPLLLQIFVFGIAVITIAITFFKAIQFVKLLAHLKRILRSSLPCEKTILNRLLHDKLNKLNAIILISNEVQVPFAANQRHILFPEYLINELSQDEYEAVVAHEVEHLSWKDPILKLFFVSVCSLFWWIPTNWWLRRLVADQEQASDAGLYQYGLDVYNLATALMKVVRKAQSSKYEQSAICYLHASESTHLIRLKSMINHVTPSQQKFYPLKTISGVFMCLLVFISFWMC